MTDSSALADVRHRPDPAPTLWSDERWTARVIKNEDDDGWAVAMTRHGDPEPALVGPWTMGRDKKNPKPLDAPAFHTLVKTANEVLRRHEQQLHAQLNKQRDRRRKAAARIRVALQHRARRGQPARDCSGRTTNPATRSARRACGRTSGSTPPARGLDRERLCGRADQAPPAKIACRFARDGSSGRSTTVEAEQRLSFAVPSKQHVRAARQPISQCWQRTVVERRRCTMSTSGMSLWPVIETCCGTRMPCSLKRSRCAPSATRSLAAHHGVGNRMDAREQLLHRHAPRSRGCRRFTRRNDTGRKGAQRASPVPRRWRRQRARSEMF